MDNWNAIRNEAINSIKQNDEKVLKSYLDEINFKDVFAYDYDYSTNTMVIYTARPGIWIGKGGIGVNRLRELLSKNIKENCKVEFKEIRGNFVVHL